MPDKEILLNSRIDALVDALDSERRRLDLTNGEILLFVTVVMAGLMRASQSQTDLRAVMTFVVNHMMNTPLAPSLLTEVMKLCEVKPEIK